jgi:hypothetical protein
MLLATAGRRYSQLGEEKGRLHIHRLLSRWLLSCRTLYTKSKGEDAVEISTSDHISSSHNSPKAEAIRRIEPRITKPIIQRRMVAGAAVGVRESIDNHS